MNIGLKIAALRSLMNKHDIDGYIIPSSDPHQSEYVADHWKSREWISGFTGSAGMVIITRDHAGLWTDSRYFLHAEQQLKDTEVVLHKLVIPHAPEHIEWLKENLPKGSVIGCDGIVFSLGQMQRLKNNLSPKGIEIAANVDFISQIWEDRPSIPLNPVFELAVRYAGQSRKEKLKSIRQKMKEQKANYHLVTTLDDIAYMLNIRSNDVECNPVAIAYAVVGEKEAFLFIDEEKLPDDVKSGLIRDGVFIRPYEKIGVYLHKLPESAKILIDPGTINFGLYRVIAADKVVRGINIPRKLKAIKNEVEVSHIRDAMRKDGVALTRMYRWLEEVLEARTVSEVELAKQLNQFRSEQGDYFGESFPAIVGFRGNGAIVHYHAQADTCAQISKEGGILLIDSGGQYLNGTTDITRTITIGNPTEEQKRHFTLVLKGHIALNSIHFPEGTAGAQLDTLARMYLWKDHLNYGHGTGHGVGFFLNVHEPPQGFATSAVTSRGGTAFEVGMLTSNEPGYYKIGEYGIRTENLVLCVEAGETDSGRFLKFENLTLFPIDLDLVEPSLLSEEEKNWLNAYHEEVYEKVSPLLTEEEKQWLREKCVSVG